jgi:hypothetical protein
MESTLRSVTLERLAKDAEARLRRHFAKPDAKSIAEGEAFVRYGRGLRPQEFGELFERVAYDLSEKGEADIQDCLYLGRFKLVPKRLAESEQPE